MTEESGQEGTFASTANSVFRRSPGVLFGVLSRWTLARLLCGPNHRLDANLHISLGGRKIRYPRIAVRPDAIAVAEEGHITRR